MTDPEFQITSPEPTEDDVLSDEELAAAGADAEDAEPEDDPSTSPETPENGGT